MSDNIESADVVSDVESNGERGGNGWVEDVSCSYSCRSVTCTTGRITKVPCILRNSVISKISVLVIDYDLAGIP